MPEIHVVQEGECFDSIASEYGFFPETLWEHGENSQLRELRESMNLLVPGDEVHIPDFTAGDRDSEPEQRHRFRRKGVPSRFRIKFTDARGEPLANVAFRTIIDDTIGPDGTTDADGGVDIPVPPGAERLKLILKTELAWAKENDFILSNLQPVDTIEGLQARLHSLGFYHGELDGEDSEVLKGAIAAFAADKELTLPDDPASQEVQDAVSDAYGC